jgi:hypothetical protein
MKPCSLARDLLLTAGSQLRDIMEKAKWPRRLVSITPQSSPSALAVRSNTFGCSPRWLRSSSRALLDAFNEHVSRLSEGARNRRGSRVLLGIERLWGLGRKFVGGEQGRSPSHGRSSVHPELTPFRASRSIRPHFNHFPSLIKSSVGNGSLQFYKIAEASERINGNQHVIDERPSPDSFDRYEKFVSQRNQQ